MIRTLVALLSAAAAVVSAAEPEKPVIVVSRAAVCQTYCLQLDAALAHPAMQRRLGAVTLERHTLQEGEGPFIALQFPAGNQVMRWHDAPDWLMVADVLTLVEGAMPHLRRSHAATDTATKDREFALAILSLGDRHRGKALLQAMQTSDSQENQALAAVWLARLDTPREDVIVPYAQRGSTDRVKFEAWMAIGDVRLDAGQTEKAIEAYDRAGDFTEERSIARASARVSRQRAATMASPVLGLGLPGTVVAGCRSIQPKTTPKGTARVEYRLEGKLAATAKRAPFIAPVNFGRLPTRQTLEVTARNAGGKVLSRSLVVINERSDSFRVHFVEPATHELSGKIDVLVDAAVPRGRSMDELIVEWNGKRVARFTAPPYRTRFDARSYEPGVLRAVLRLDDGSETEDVLLANTGKMLIEAGAHLVEVPAYFDKGNPATKDVIVKEAGVQRRVEQIIKPEEAPLMIALAIDSSQSMIEHMLDVQEAAVRFVESHIEPRDAAMIVAFNNNARVLHRGTSDRALLTRSILSLRPRGATALYDAIINALLQLQSSGSRRALVLFSDGLDGSSVFSSSDVAEVARRAGVPIYVFVFTPGGIPYTFEGAQQLSRAKTSLITLSKRTGGQAFEMKTLGELDSIWNEIGADLRKQSLVIYRTDTAGAEWRPLEIAVKGRGAVRAPSGVYVTSEP